MKNNTRPCVEQLVLELTRKCNMCCNHCLRGKSQDVEMSLNTAINTIKKFSSINSITFTGGEPTLCEDLIEQIVDYIIKNHINVHGFYIASNGKKVSMPTMISLSRLYAYIYELDGYMDDYQCVFDISRDQFHEKLSSTNLGVLHAFSFVNERGEIPEMGIIDEGSASNFKIGHRKLSHYKEFEYEEMGNENTYEMVYVNAKGNILPDCDFSYDTQDYLSDISICERCSFNTLAKRYNTNISSK